jgi:site-specific recombinase XerD
MSQSLPEREALMTNLTLVPPKRHKPCEALDDAFLDFLLSREAMLCSPATMKYYKFTGGKIIEWLGNEGITEPEEITARHVRAYLSTMARRGLSDSYIHSHARVFRTILRFLYEEEYVSRLIKFKMPIIAQKRLPILTPDELQCVIKGCTTPRDRAMIVLVADTGVRRSEACSLNWDDVDIQSGLVSIRRGKGGKSRSVVIGVTTRRAVLAYRRTVRNDPRNPLIQTSSGKRLSPNGLRSALLRIGDRCGVHVTPHILRRTFATLSLKAGMNPLHLQGLLGHSSLEMTRRYIQMVDEDLLVAHKEYGPIDRYLL